MAVGVAQKVLLTGHAHEYQVGDRERRGDDPFGRQAYPRVNGDRLLDGAVTGERGGQHQRDDRQPAHVDRQYRDRDERQHQCR
ncbi:Uncharacterised protein [Mycobacteroides abscessus subsp. massiliense]|nr:Uncharacterised protein [Mycobacteroides abscessus subsp. massiliense]